MEEFFDEKSGKWIDFYKKITIVQFWLYMIAAVFTCFLAWGDYIWITGYVFLDGLICLVAIALVAFIQLVVNMLIIQLLNNVQIIRDKLENKE